MWQKCFSAAAKEQEQAQEQAQEKEQGEAKERKLAPKPLDSPEPEAGAETEVGKGKEAEWNHRCRFVGELNTTLFGSVQKVYDETTRQMVAIKVSLCDEEMEAKGAPRLLSSPPPSSPRPWKATPENPLEEKAVYEHLVRKGLNRFPYIVHYRGHCSLQDEAEGRKHLGLVLEYVEGQELFEKVVQAPFGFSERIARHYFLQIAFALQFLHSHNVCHLDLSLENVLVTKDGLRAKLCDFGQAEVGHLLPHPRRASPPCTKQKDAYRCPELALPPSGSQAHSFPSHFDGRAADVWSLAGVLWVMLTCTPMYSKPFQDHGWFFITRGSKSMRQWLLHSWNHRAHLRLGPPRPQPSPGLLHLLSGMLHPEPKHRLTIRQVLSHPWSKEACLLGPADRGTL